MCQPAAPAVSKPRFPSEIAMLIGLLGNSFAVAMLAKSDIGLTTTSLLSFVMSRATPISLGTWSYLIQCGCIVVLAILLRRVKVGYILSFGLSVVFGLLVDLFVLLLAPLPVSWPFRVAYYLLGTCVMITGISFFMRCRLPILPIDTFTRDLSAHFGVSLKRVRTTLDITCFVLSAAIGLVFVGGLPGIGAGTIASTLFVGTFVGRLSGVLDESFAFSPFVPALGRLIEE